MQCCNVFVALLETRQQTVNLGHPFLHLYVYMQCTDLIKNNLTAEV